MRMNAEGHARREPDAFRPPPRLLATLCFSAEKDFLALARSTTVHVAGLLDLPFSRANDLRLAVDEACALFLAASGAKGSVGGLALVFTQIGGQLRITVSGPTPLRQPDVGSLGWMLLCALVGEPRWEVEEDVGTLTLYEPIPLLN
jgi:hypothetical protein